MNPTELLIALVHGLGLMALVAVLYGSIERVHMARPLRSVLHGLTFGAAAVMTMMSPAVLVPGVIIDARAIMVALAGAFTGPVAAVTATIVAGLYRLSIGGVGAPAGVMTLLYSCVVGLVWRYAWCAGRPITQAGLLVLGAAIGAHALFVALVPVEMSRATEALIIFSLAASSLFATQVLGGMMRREHRLIAREKSLIDDAFTDLLTGLPNRRALVSAEPGVLAASQARGYTVLLVDADHFKAINDTHGHEAGDVALRILAETLSRFSRSADLVCRFGGEEFVVVLPAATEEEGWAVARRILSGIRGRLIVVPEASFSMTVSIGLAHARGLGLLDAVALADEALYRAKAAGRDRIAAAPVQPGPAVSADPGAPAATRAVHRAA